MNRMAIRKCAIVLPGALLAMAMLASMGVGAVADPADRDTVNTVLTQVATTYDLPANLLKAMAYQESKWLQFGHSLQDQEIQERGRAAIEAFIRSDPEIDWTDELSQAVANVSIRVERESPTYYIGIGIMQVTVYLDTEKGVTPSHIKNLVLSMEFNVEEGARILLSMWKFAQDSNPACVPADDSYIIENWWYPVLYYNGDEPAGQIYAERIVGLVRDPEGWLGNYMAGMGWVLPSDVFPNFQRGHYFSARDTLAGGLFVHIHGAQEHSSPGTIHRWKDVQAQRVVTPVLETMAEYTEKKEQGFAAYLGTYLGVSYNGYHAGEDIGVPRGTVVRAIAPGWIVKISDLGGEGKMIVMEHRGSFAIRGRDEEVEHGKSYSYPHETVDRIYSVYVHINPLSSLILGRYVAEGEQIATVAITTLPDHLHFEIRHPAQDPSCNWSMVGSEENWTRGYYKDPQLMVDGGVRHPSDFLSHNAHLPETAARIAVTHPHYDNMAAILDGLGRDYDEIDPGELADLSKIQKYSAIFVNCAGGLEQIAEAAAASGSVRDYVAGGGVLYTSDFAFAFVDQSLPGYIQFAGRNGLAGYVDAEVVDEGLANHLKTDTLNLHFDMGGWVPVEAVDPSASVFVQGEVTYADTTGLRPIVVKLEHGEGLVIYTAFHHAAQDAAAASLMEYLAGFVLTEPLSRPLRDDLTDEGYIVAQDMRGFVADGQIIDFEYEATPGEGFEVALNWPAWQGATLGLAVYDPDGTLVGSAESSTPPMRLTVPPANSPYSYTVTGVDVPGANIEFAVVVGSLDPGPLTAWASPDPVEGIESVTFGVRGRDAQKVERIRVRVTDQAGYAVFPPAEQEGARAEQEGTRFIWDTLEPTGVPVPNGIYNFSVSVYLEGRWVVLPLQSLIIHR